MQNSVTEKETLVKQMIDNAMQSDVMVDPNDFEIFKVPVDDGNILVYHHCPKEKIAARPLVFVSGWSALIQSFPYLTTILRNRVEYYFIETREKNSSEINRKFANLSVNQKAKDIRNVLDYLGFNDGRDFLLAGTCWGASVILQGLITKKFSAPTVIAIDPMHRLWFKRWLLKWVVPVTPAWFWHLIRPLGRRIALYGMEESEQKNRFAQFINNAIVWKWKRGAEQCADFELYGNLHKIENEVFVFNASGDKIHNPDNYPKIAAEIPRGRFIFMKSALALREHSLAVMLLEFAKVRRENGIPASLQIFEKKLCRQP